ncbi:MAG: hypothetical protein GY847_41925 [Proteobacteria bacterium]|nr:hypothetical protein [Pseudomonadota bacterium]
MYEENVVTIPTKPRHRGYVPKNQADREYLKQEANDMLQPGRPLATLLRGALMLLRAWYDRDYYKLPRGFTFQEYVREFNLKKQFGFYDGVVDELRSKYGHSRLSKKKREKLCDKLPGQLGDR